jgi:hypothetical protein
MGDGSRNRQAREHVEACVASAARDAAIRRPFVFTAVATGERERIVFEHWATGRVELPQRRGVLDLVQLSERSDLSLEVGVGSHNFISRRMLRAAVDE